MSSNKTIFAIIGFVIVVILIGGALLLFTRSDDTPQELDTSPQVTQTAATLVIVEDGITVTRNDEIVTQTSDEIVIYEGDIVKTDETGTGYIIFADDSITAIDSSTEIKIEAHESTATSTVVKIKQLVGKTRSNVNKVAGKDTSYSVETSNTLASVRNTIFGCETTDGMTTCFSEEGTVKLTLTNITDPNIPNEIDISDGQELTNNDNTVFTIESLEDLINLIKEYAPPDTPWTDFVECLDIGIDDYGISCEDIEKELDEQLPLTGDETTSSTTITTSIVTTIATTTLETSTIKPSTSTTTTTTIEPPRMSQTITVGGTLDDTGKDVATDDYGHVYVTGSFQGTNIDFGASGGLNNLLGLSNWATQHSSNGGEDAFLSKYNPDGSHAWTRTWGGTGAERGRGITVGMYDDVYVVGDFQSTEVNFDDTGGEAVLDYGGVVDFYIVKYNTDGSFGWVRQTGDAENPTYAGNVTVDVNGDPVAVGYFSATNQDFDGTTGTDLHSTAGLDDGFITRYSRTGTYGQTVTFGGSTSSELALDIENGGSGEIAVVGTIIDTLFDAYIRLYNTALSLQWQEVLSSTQNDEAWGVTVDSQGTVFVSGYYEGELDFDPGTGEEVHIPVGLEDAFLTARTNTGDHLWTRTWGGLANDSANDVDVLGGIVVLTGMFEGSNTNLFGLGTGSSGTDLHTALGGSNLNISHYLRNGTFVEAFSFGASGDQTTWGVDIDYFGNVYVTGGFHGTNIEFNGIDGGDVHSAIGGEDIYLTQYQNLVSVE